MTERKQRGKAGDKTICLPIEEGINYSELVKDREAYRVYLNAVIAKHPEIFPEGIVYHAASKREFAQRLRRFLEWANGQTLRESIDRRLQRLKHKSSLFQKAYDFPGASRTSNAVDRPMNDLDRCLFSMQYFHGSWTAAVQAGQAMALL